MFCELRHILSIKQLAQTICPQSSNFIGLRKKCTPISSLYLQIENSAAVVSITFSISDSEKYSYLLGIEYT